LEEASKAKVEAEAQKPQEIAKKKGCSFGITKGGGIKKSFR
jgi:hypothetical protein